MMHRDNPWNSIVCQNNQNSIVPYRTWHTICFLLLRLLPPPRQLQLQRRRFCQILRKRIKFDKWVGMVGGRYLVWWCAWTILESWRVYGWYILLVPAKGNEYCLEKEVNADNFRWKARRAVILINGSQTLYNSCLSAIEKILLLSSEWLKGL